MSGGDTGGYRLELTGPGTLYQYDEGGVLRALPTSEIDVSRPFFSAPGATDSDHDQGDEPVELGAEWIDVGRLEPVDGQTFGVDVAEAWIAPLGTPAPNPARLLRAAPPRWVTEEGPVGPPIPVRHEERPDGSYVTGYLGPAHPAYAAVRAGLTPSLSIVDEAVGESAVNGPYVNQDAPPVPAPPATVASPAVNGLGREHISRRAHVPPPARIGLGDAVAALFGAELTGDPAEPVREAATVRANRADRRRAQRSRRRG